MENINKSLINKLRTKDREFGVIGSFYYKITKRIFDILFSLILLIVASPILIVSLIIVFLQDFKNPIFHKRELELEMKSLLFIRLDQWFMMLKRMELNGLKKMI